jgi:Phage phiEco32-like COOH.NH2 ligase-type 2
MCFSKAEPKELVPLRQRGRPPGPYGVYRKVRIGADLEIELHRNGQFFPAHNLLSGLHTPIGVDGNTSTGELRPCLKTGGRVDSLFYFDKDSPNAPDSQGLSVLLAQLARKLDETFAVYAGSGCHKPLGGHLHFSGVSPDIGFLAVLDRFIAIPLNEVSNIQLRVERYYYGRLSSVEVGKSHGGFEYRSPPSWISTPDLAKGVLSIAWLLAQAQKHGRISHFQTWDDFYEYSSKGHTKHIKKFTMVIADLKQGNIKLEEIEVLKAWEKRHLLKTIKKPIKNTRKKPTPVARAIEWALDDSYIPEIAERVGRLTSPLELRIVGAHQSRSPRKAVFFPAGWRGDLPNLRDIAFQQWNLPWIGLSWSLRQDVELAARAVRTIVRSGRPPLS